MHKPVIHRAISHTLALAAIAAPLALTWGCDSDPSEADPQAEPTAAALEEELPPLRDGEERFGEGVTKITEVTVSGTRLVFLHMLLPGMDTASLELLESSAPGAISIGIEPAFAQGSLLDLFLAVTGPEVDIPDELIGEPDHELGERGWFVERLAQNYYKAPRNVCTNAGFQTALRDFQPSIDGQELWLLDTITDEGDGNWYGPEEDPYDLGLQCTGTCTPKWYAHNWNSWDWPAAPHSDSDTSKESVAICALGTHPQVCSTSNGQCISHLGPTIQFWHRTEANAATSVVYSIDLAAPGYLRLHHIGNSTNNDFDRRIRIFNAVAGESFDIGYITEDHGW